VQNVILHFFLLNAMLEVSC